MCLGGLDSYLLLEFSHDTAKNTDCKMCRIAVVVGPPQSAKFPKIRDKPVGILGLDKPDTVCFDNIMSVRFLLSVSVYRGRPILQPLDWAHGLVDSPLCE